MQTIKLLLILTKILILKRILTEHPDKQALHQIKSNQKNLVQQFKKI